MLSVYVVSFILIFYGKTVQCYTTNQSPMPMKGLSSWDNDGNAMHHESLKVRSELPRSLLELLFTEFGTNQKQTVETNLIQKIPSNCAEAMMETQESGIYTLKVRNYGPPFPVYCDANTFGGNWTVIQRRLDGSEDFYRNWTDYKNGFGNLRGEFFIGLDKLHALTSESTQELLIELEDFENEVRFARYHRFGITAEDEDFTMNLFGYYSGNANDSLSYHGGMKFTTKDRDNDENLNENCAVKHMGAWWYNDCHHSNLNGLYLNGEHTQSYKGVEWGGWKGPNYSLKRVQMLIRPKYP